MVSIPQAEADKRVWLRRVSLDLIWPAADAEELDAFVADQSPEAHDKVVDAVARQSAVRRALGPTLDGYLALQRLVGAGGRGPQFAETHLALARLDRRVAELGQRLRPDAARNARRRRTLSQRPRSAASDRISGPAVLHLQSHHAGWTRRSSIRRKAMLGLTFNCAKCHDHKYDPFSQVEYYQLRAALRAVSDSHRDGSRPDRTLRRTASRACSTRISTCRRTCTCAATIAIRTRAARWNPPCPRFLSSDEMQLAIAPVSLPVEATYPGLREFVVTRIARPPSNRLRPLARQFDAARKTLVESEAVAKAAAAKTELAAASTEALRQPTNRPSSSSATISRCRKARRVGATHRSMEL